MTARILGRNSETPGAPPERIVALLCDNVFCGQALHWAIKPGFRGTDQQAIIEANSQVVNGLTPGWWISGGLHYCGRHVQVDNK